MRISFGVNPYAIMFGINLAVGIEIYFLFFAIIIEPEDKE